MANTTCAPWLNEYVDWHTTNRYAADARYLVYTCRPEMPGAGQGGHCFGFGDRFRLIGYMLRAAALYRRVLLVDWASPVDISEFFAPPVLHGAGGRTIEWRLTQAERDALSEQKVLRWLGPEPEPPGDRYVRVVGNSPWQSRLGRGPGMGEFDAPSLGCLLRVLFTPSTSLNAVVAHRRRELFGSSGYDGVHLRLGDAAPGTAFRPGTVPRTDVRMSVDDALEVLSCLDSAGHTPLFVATDNARLKAAILAGSGRGGASVPDAGVLLPSHLAGRVKSQGCADCMVNPVFLHNFNYSDVADIFVEMLLLSQSRCFHYYSGSNFAAIVMALAPPSHCNLPYRGRGARAPVMPKEPTPEQLAKFKLWRCTKAR